MKNIADFINHFLDTYAEQILETMIVIALLECIIFSFVDDYVVMDLALSIRINFVIALDSMFLIFRAIDAGKPLKKWERINIVGMLILLIIPLFSFLGILKL